MTTLNELFTVYVLLLIFERKYVIIFEHVLDLLNFHFFMKVHSATSGRTFPHFCWKVVPRLNGEARSFLSTPADISAPLDSI